MGWWRQAIQAAKKNDPAVKSSVEVVLTYPGVHAMFCHRFSHFLYRHHRYLLARINSQLTKFFTGIEIHPGAQIAPGVFIDHGTGIVIGETAVVETGVVMFHGVTLGGTGKHTGKRHPTIRKGAFLSANAKILGPIEIGENTKIGAGAVVLESIPANATAVGLPAKVVKLNGRKIHHD
ncbi:serine O-acetyltransferase EpsC [Enterococcus sp. CSURQ0835]|uniref:serine O-acetyltransferase EpsC n=1 Tax=Enterococcus sp. CSURQ0835 TaxID=2681394 RepID=UPI00135C8D18|nr:serine O-acetyltransferase EpsC [Enterococcus sp. CSURQ0835]